VRWAAGAGTLRGRACSAILLARVVAIAAAAPEARADPGSVLDAFEDLSPWSAAASPGASVEIARDAGRDGQALRIDFDLGIGGWVMVRRPLPLRLPENYVFSFQVRGEAPRNNLEFKLVDPTGDNVWWSIERDFAFPHDWERVTVRRSHMRYAWGKSGGKQLDRVGYLEIAITAGTGGKGSVWIDDLQFEPRPARPRTPPKPKITASTSTEGHPPANAIDGDPGTAWRSGAVADQQWIEIDFGALQEFGGLVIDWDPEDYAVAYRVEVSPDGQAWTTVHQTTTGQGKRDYIYLHDTEASRLRLALERSSRGQGYAIRSIAVKPIEFSASPNDFFAAIAADSPPGTFPKYFTGKQSYWTVVGVPGDDAEGLLNEEGMLEVGAGAFSIEPFLYLAGEFASWNGPETAQSLERRYLPIPSVTWRVDGVSLAITALASGPAGSSTLYARYRVQNETDARNDVLLFLALRPFQVLPPWQSLNAVGGVTPIRTLASSEPGVAVVNGDRPVTSLTPPERFGAATFEEDLVGTYLEHGRVPTRADTSDPFGYAAGAFEYRLALEPREHADVVLAIPFHPDRASATATPKEPPADFFERELSRVAGEWERDLGRVALDLPGPEGERIADIAKTTLAYIEINRDGVAIQPGSRNYARSWIRDGAFTASALLAFAHPSQVRDFLAWFAGFQFPDGRIPCCVDHRGPDRVPENDSNGEFVYGVAYYYAYTRDIGFVWQVWPNVVRAIDFIAAQRAQRTTKEYEKPDRIAAFGLLPESISHEGYSARPVHAYWDDFFALRGLEDAVGLARVVGDDARATSWATLRDAFRRDLYASLERTMAAHHIEFLPGSVELGDFDATSTAAAITPVGEIGHLPAAALAKTFDMYMSHVRARAARPPGDEGYTPYEFRNVDALVQMGRRDDALALLRFMLADVRPAAWNEWAEVVWRDASLPRFIGDMPHTWVGSSFLRAIRSMIAYRRDSANALVLGAGLPAAWVLDAPGVGVARLPTPYGILSYRVARAGDRMLRWSISGDLTVPPGGIVLEPPLPAALTSLRVNGVASDAFTATAATVREFPADVVLEWAPPAAPPATGPGAPASLPAGGS